jgi:hypothetical protein
MSIATIALVIFVAVVSLGLFGFAYPILSIIGGVAGLVYVIVTIAGGRIH